MAEFASAAEAPAARAVIHAMGFDHDMVQHALAQAGGNEQLAIDLILSGEAVKYMIWQLPLPLQRLSLLLLWASAALPLVSALLLRLLRSPPPPPPPPPTSTTMTMATMTSLPPPPCRPTFSYFPITSPAGVCHFPSTSTPTASCSHPRSFARKSSARSSSCRRRCGSSRGNRQA
jgi:hypothetical protein